MIGTFGPITFVCSDQRILTFMGFSRGESARWGKHDVIGKKSKSEFLGPDIGTVSFEIRLDAHWGINPRKELDALTTMVRNGEVHRLLIGGKGLGVNKWYITNVNQSWDKIDNKGNVIIARATLTLEEYV